MWIQAWNGVWHYAQNRQGNTINTACGSVYCVWAGMADDVPLSLEEKRCTECKQAGKEKNDVSR